MPERPSSNVKIYDRPERKLPSPILLVVGLLILLVVGYFVYRTYVHAPVPAKAPAGFLPVLSVLMPESPWL